MLYLIQYLGFTMVLTVLQGLAVLVDHRVHQD